MNAAFLQALASASMFLPLLFLNYYVFLGSTDALFYTTVLRLMGDHIAAADFQPLWLPEANGGSGSPVMLFYSPLAYQITAVLGLPLMPFDPMGDLRLLFGMFAAQWVAGMAAFAWLRRMVSEKNALAASLLFTIFPYKLIYMFVHVNLAQLWAIAWLPLLMIAAMDMTKHQKGATGRYAIWVALIALTHPRTLVAFAALPVLYAFFFTQAQRGKVLARLAAAHALGLAMAAFYLLPALLNLGLVHAGLTNVGRFHYAGNLMHKDIVLNFHYAIIAALALGLFSRIPALRKNSHGQEIIFYLVMLAGVLFMCLRISQPIWDALPILQFLQFPAARLHCVALIAATALCAIFFQYYRKVHVWRAFYSPASILMPVLAMAAVIFMDFWEIYEKVDPNIDRAYVEKIHDKDLILPPEYLTKWQSPETAVYIFAEQSAARPLVSFAGNNAAIESSWPLPRELHFSADIAQEQEAVKIRQIYVPNWSSSMGAVKPAEDGTMTLELPQGKHDVVLTLLPFKGEREGWMITSTACMLVALMVNWRRKNRFRFR